MTFLLLTFILLYNNHLLGVCLSAFYALRQKVVHKGFLSNDKLQLLAGAELSAEMDRIRNIFLFACYTGLAYCEEIILG
jgi:hypothetical protein